MNRVQQVGSDLTQEYEREPTADELASEMHLPEKVVLDAIAIGSRPLSLDAPIGAAEENTLQDVLSNGEDHPDTWIMNESLCQEVRRALETLEPREAVVLRLYFGVDCERTHTLDEISDHLNLTRERVRQIKEKGLRKLRHRSRARELMGYLG